MALITRISRLFTADVHAVLDRIEEPEVVLRQAIREMAEEIARSEQRLRWLEGETRQLRERETDASATIADLDAELDLCFAAGEEELARSLVKRKLVAEQQRKQASRRLEELKREHERLSAQIAEWQASLEDTRQKAELFAEAQHESTLPAGEPTIGQDAVDVAFLKEKQRRQS
jgi:phage shock protein A